MPVDWLAREPDCLGSAMGSSRMEEKGLEGWKELVDVREGALSAAMVGGLVCWSWLSLAVRWSLSR